MSSGEQGPGVMMIGVYLPSHNNPCFLRMALLQLLIQTRPPDLVVFHINGDERDYSWAIEDLLRGGHFRSSRIIKHFSAGKLPEPQWQLVPLRTLVQRNCDVFFKFDHDDIYYSRHIERMIEPLAECDWVAQRHLPLLTIPPMGASYKYEPRTDFTKINPLGASASSCCFNRRFASTYVHALEAAAGTPDDVVMGVVLRSFRKRVVSFAEPTCCYVAHGGNVSSASMAVEEWRRQHLALLDRQISWQGNELGEALQAQLMTLWAGIKGPQQGSGNA